MGAVRVREGILPGGQPCLRFGDGPSLIALSGLTGAHCNPRGLDRSAQLAMYRQPARSFTVHLANRRRGLLPGTTMHDLAEDVATSIRQHFHRPVPLVGSSTGGSIALQVAIDHPELVSRLVLLCAACRLSDEGRRRQRRLAELVAAGKPRRAWAQLGPVLAATRVGQAAVSVLMWLAGRSATPEDPSDLLVTIAAEDAFDATADLSRVQAPTLVVGGGRDGFYSRELFERTAAGIPDCRLLLRPRTGHMATPGRRCVRREVTHFLELDRT